MALVIESEERMNIPMVGMRTFKYSHCECGAEIVLYDFTNYCDNEKCDFAYNLSGQRLAPRSHWGEETGEHPADVAGYSFFGGEDW